MKHLSLSAALIAVVLLGAGCDALPSTSKLKMPEQPPAGPAAVNGFGLLPTIAAPGTLGTPEAMSSRMAYAPTMPPSAADPAMAQSENAVGMANVVTKDMAGSSGGGTTGAMVIRPMPEMKPANVNYKITAQLPTWGSEDDVLRAKTPTLPSGSIQALAAASGMPSQALGKDPNLTSVSFSWKDNDGLTWNYDTLGRNVGFWKETDYRIMADPNAGQKMPPVMEDAEALRIANDFLTRKGFSSFARGTGEVEKPYGMTEPASMPCPVPMPLTKDMPAVEVDAAKVTEAEARKMEDTKVMIAPCGGWYPQQITVSFTAMIGSKPVHDMGGWPFRTASVQIDLNTRQVTGGNVWMPQEMEASKYALISAEEAMKRLNAGGRNPIYPYYGEEVTDINITISNAKLVLMRYDAWAEGKNTTYFLPALVGEGTVSYGDRDDIYRTIVPLVADDAFGGNDPGYGKPMPADAVMTSPPAATMPAPAPALKQ
ncbi:MAG: hypothetical protein WC787_00775 [Patescibacteria group bacterium]|jgi:hypothetical protein